MRRRGACSRNWWPHASATEVADTLVLVEHPHVLTLGRGARRDNLLASGDMQVFEVERGGDVTYHGPGQLCGYPILYLRGRRAGRDLYLRHLEEALILTLAEFGIEAGRRLAHRGVGRPAQARPPSAWRCAAGSPCTDSRSTYALTSSASRPSIPVDFPPR